MRGHFLAWLPGSGHADAVVFAYNRARGGFLTPAANGDPLDLPDWHGPALHRYQAADVRRFALSSGMINGYDVGVGKTLFAIALTGLLRRQGHASRPIIVVPAGLVGMWAGEAQACFPGWRVLPIGMSRRLDRQGQPLHKRHPDGSVMRDRRGNPIPEWVEDSAATKRVKLGRFAAGEAELAIMSRESFTAIPMTDENRAHFIAVDPEFQRRSEAREGFDDRGRKGRHEALKRQLAFQASCAARLRRDAGLDLPFEALGVDLILFDEAHAMKSQHAPETVLGETPAWLGAGGESNRALDALYKARYTRQQGGSTYALSASWLKNSPIEFSAMLNLVCDELPARGLGATADFMEQYLKIEPRIVAAPDGSIQVKPAVVGFQRLRELRRLMDAHVTVRKAGDAEVVTADGTPLHVPAVRTEEVVFSMTPEQAALYRQLRGEARAASQSSERESHLFSVMWRMRKLAADPALLGLGCENPRFQAITERLLAERTLGGKSLVFLGIGVVEGSLERLKQQLVAAGYPPEEIEVVTSGTHASSRARADLSARYNYGGLSCVLGSDVLSEGFDLQIGTTLICEGDLGWNYELSRQRLGRGARQGNTGAFVKHAVFLLKDSFDLLMLSMVCGKKSWRDQLDGVQDEALNTGGDFSAEELVLLLSEDVEGTKAEINAKKEALAELTGLATLRRKLELIGRAHALKVNLQEVITRANGRKRGWTAHDYLRVTNARRALSRALAELDDPRDFPLARLAQYRGRLSWTGGIPFHLGMRFSLGEASMTVTALSASDLTVALADGRARTLTHREVLRAARDFQPTLEDAAYDAIGAAVGAPELAVRLAEGAAIHALNGQAVNPLPRSGEVLTVVVKGGQVEAVSAPSKESQRFALQTGGTVIHYLTESGADGLSITTVAVLAPHEQARAQTQQAIRKAAFHARLIEIARLALAAYGASPW